MEKYDVDDVIKNMKNYEKEIKEYVKSLESRIKTDPELKDKPEDVINMFVFKMVQKKYTKFTQNYTSIVRDMVFDKVSWPAVKDTLNRMKKNTSNLHKKNEKYADMQAYYTSRSYYHRNIKQKSGLMHMCKKIYKDQYDGIMKNFKKIKEQEKKAEEKFEEKKKKLKEHYKNSIIKDS